MVAGLNLGWQGAKKKAVYTRGAGSLCECTGWGSGHLGVQIFFNWLLKLTNHKRPKVTCFIRH